MNYVDHFKEVLAIFGELIEADESISEEEKEAANSAVNIFIAEDFSDPDALKRIKKKIKEIQ